MFVPALRRRLEGSLSCIGGRVEETEDGDHGVRMCVSDEREEKRRKRNEARRKKRADNSVKQEGVWEGRLGVIT